MKYKLTTAAILFTVLIGCSVPRGHYSHRGDGVRGHQQNQRVYYKAKHKEKIAQRRARGKQKEE